MQIGCDVCGTKVPAKPTPAGWLWLKPNPSWLVMLISWWAFRDSPEREAYAKEKVFTEAMAQLGVRVRILEERATKALKDAGGFGLHVCPGCIAGAPGALAEQLRGEGAIDVGKLKEISQSLLKERS